MDCRPSTAPDHPNLLAVSTGNPRKLRKTYCFTGLSRYYNFSVYNNSLTTLVRGIKERVFFVNNGLEFTQPYRPTARYFKDTLQVFSEDFKKYIQYTTPMQAEHFAQSYHGRRRTVYLNAVEENLTRGFDPKTSHIRVFVKAEKYNFTLKPDAVPRVIQPRHPRYIVETGRYIKTIEKKIYKGIDKLFDDRTVYKGMNMLDRGISIKRTWDKYRHPVAFSIDASRFDQHVSNAALKWEHSIYQRFFPGDTHFKRLMNLQRSNKAVGFVADGRVHYSTIHNRMSGDSNTSLGNVLITCAIFYSYRQTYNLQYSLINDGDDCVIICEKEDFPSIVRNIPSYCKDLGFTMNIEHPVDTIEQIEFCQSHPVLRSDGKYVMVRDPRISFSKDAVSLKPLSTNSLARRWMAAVGIGGLTLTSGLPVLPNYYGAYLRNADGAKPLSDPTLEGGFFRNSVGMSTIELVTTQESRYSFWLAFGISPEEQFQLERYYDELVIQDGDVRNRFALLPYRGL